MPHTPFTQNDYEITKREVPYEGVFRLARYHFRFRLFRGGFSKVISREVLERSSAVGVLPYDPIRDTVILIEQFRIGAIANPQSPWVTEIVAGIINGAEKPEEVAIREAKEESDSDLLNLFPICDYFVSPGGSNEYIHLFCGQVNATFTDAICGLPKESEDIRAYSLPSEDAFNLVQEGKIKTAPAIVTLQWLQLNRDWLRQLWQAK